ncbi:MAG: cellulase family glycosylhydrolase [Bryobacteraceae bacterium]
MTIFVRILVVALLPAAFAGTPYLIDDFEASGALQNWRAEGGRLTLGPGHREHGAILSYQLPRDASAEAVWTPSSKIPKMHDPAISLWIRLPPEVEVFLEGKDSNGQTLRVPIGGKAGEWQYVAIPLRIKGRLVEIGMMVRARARVAVEGSLSFDEVSLREASEPFHVDMSAVPQAPGPAPHLGVNIHLLQDDHALDQAHAAGFEFVRMDMLWSNVERGGRYRFFGYDRLLRALDARGMGVLWILDYGHPDHGGSPPRTPQDVAAFARFAGAAAEHFKGRNVRYEIWNEPNTRQFWKPSPDALEYGALLREAAAAIRAADPAAKVSSGGLSRFDLEFLSRAVNRELALTAIGIHPYPKGAPETVAPEMAILREWVARALGEQVEIWDTEWGYSSANAPIEAPSNGHTEAGRRLQASLAVRELLTVWTVGLPLAVFYDLRDDGTDPSNQEHNYGLLDSSGEEKPAMAAIRTLMGFLGSHKYAGMIAETPAGIHALRLDGAADTILIVWTDQPEGHRTVEFPKRNLTSMTDLMGQAVKSKDRGTGQARVEIDGAGGPVYLRWASR